MSVEYKLVPTKNNRARVRKTAAQGYATTRVVGREDNAAFALHTDNTGATTMYVRVPRADGSGLDEVVLNGRQIRTLTRVFDRHFS